MSRDEKPATKYNLVVYYDKNKRLMRRNGSKPIFHEGVYIYSDDHGDLYAQDAKKFDKNLEQSWTDDDYEEIDTVVEIINKVTDISFKYPGIWVHGLERSRGKDDRADGETYWYQSWLITTLSKEELEKENWYGY